MNKGLLFLFLCVLVTYSNLFSQSIEKDANTNDNQSHFHLKINHSTNALYLGRTDSTQTPYYGTEIGYTHKSGLYLNAAFQYFPGRVDNKFDEYSLTAGYNFNIIKDLMTGAISYSRTFYNQYSTQVTSEIQGVLTGELSLDWNVVRAGLSTIMNFGQSTDVLVSPSIGHDFSIDKFLGGKVAIGPTLTVSSGSQKLFALYKANRTFKMKKEKAKGNLKTDPSYSAFKVQDIELSMPVSYSIKKVTFTITPTYDIPQNTTTGDFTNNTFVVDFAFQVNF